MEKRHNLSLIIFVCLLVLCGCPRPIEREFAGISDETKRYTVFPAGSYWIYADSNSSDLDSVAIVSYSLDTASRPEDPCEIEVCKVHISSSYYGFTFFGGTSRESCEINLETHGMTLQTWYIQGQFHPGGGTLTDIVPGVEILQCLYAHFHDTLTVRSMAYYDVKEFEIKNSVGPSYPKRVFFAPETGIIKKVMEDGKVWELDEFHVE